MWASNRNAGLICDHYIGYNTITMKNIPPRILRQIAVGGVGRCWLWRGAAWQGYGRVKYKGKTKLAHRVIFELEKEPPPVKGSWLKPAHVMHLCGNSLCCNPEHLVAGTAKQNTSHWARVRIARKIYLG